MGISISYYLFQHIYFESFDRLQHCRGIPQADFIIPLTSTSKRNVYPGLIHKIYYTFQMSRSNTFYVLAHEIYQGLIQKMY